MESGGSESEKATHDRAIILPAKAVPSSAILTLGIVLSDQHRCELDELERSGVWSGISAVQRPRPTPFLRGLVQSRVFNLEPCCMFQPSQSLSGLWLAATLQHNSDRFHSCLNRGIFGV